MRRFKQQLSFEQAADILYSCTNGVLSLIDPEGEPYGVPISYAYDGAGHIFIHSAVVGRKVDCVGSESRCSFCVVAQDDVVPEEFTTYFRSVIVEGRVRVLTDADEIHQGLIHLCDKYCPGIDPSDEIARFNKSVKVMRIDIEHMTGKESIELVRRRKIQ